MKYRIAMAVWPPPSPWLQPQLRPKPATATASLPHGQKDNVEVGQEAHEVGSGLPQAPPLTILRPPPARAAFLTAARAGGFFCVIRSGAAGNAFLERCQAALHEMRVAGEDIAALDLGAAIVAVEKCVHLAGRHRKRRPRHLRLRVVEGDQQVRRRLRQQRFQRRCVARLQDRAAAQSVPHGRKPRQHPRRPRAAARRCRRTKARRRRPTSR